MHAIDAQTLLGSAHNQCTGQITEVTARTAAEQAVAGYELPTRPGPARDLLRELLPFNHPQYPTLFARMTCGAANIKEALVTAVTQALLATAEVSTQAA